MEKKIQYTNIVINDLGEIVFEENIDLNKKNKTINKSILKNILQNNNLDKEQKISKIQQYLYCIGECNKSNVNQYLLKDCFKYIKEIDKNIIQELKGLSIYVIKLYSIADSFNYCLKINRQTRCKTWEDIFKAIELKNITNQQKFKKFCIKNNLIRILIKDLGTTQEKYFYFNPNYKKNSCFVADNTLWLYLDIIEKNKTVNEFVIDLLKLKYE